jgi:hypothetical protein
MDYGRARKRTARTAGFESCPHWQGLDVQRRPVAANALRGHPRGHLEKQRGQIFCEDRYLDREFGGQPSHSLYFMFINHLYTRYIENPC